MQLFLLIDSYIEIWYYCSMGKKAKMQIFKPIILAVLGLAIFFSIIFLSDKSVVDKLREENNLEFEKQIITNIMNDLGRQIFSHRIGTVSKLAKEQKLVYFLNSNKDSLELECNLILENYRKIINAQFVYLMDTSGITRLSTTNEHGLSFKGNNYSFRPYFKRAIEGQTIVYPAVGVTTGKRGLYFSSPIFYEGSNRILGVAVIKVGAEEIDNLINRSKRKALLVSPEGIVFSSSEKNILLKSINEVDKIDLDKIKEERQFHDIIIDNKPLKDLYTDHIILQEDLGKYFSAFIDQMANWKVILISPYDRSFPLTMMQKYVVLLSTISIVLLIVSITVFIIIYNKMKVVWNKYSAIVENANEAILVLDAKGKLEYCNDKFLKLAGSTFENINGSDIFCFIHDDNREKVRNYFKKRFNNEKAPPYYEVKAVTQDGVVRWILISATKINWGNEPAILVFVMDITNRKQIEGALVKSEKMYRGLIESMKEGLIVFDDEERVTFVNSEFCNLLELRKQDIIGERAEKIFDKEKYVDLVRSRKSNNEKTDRLKKEVEISTASGEKTILVSPTLIYDDSGNYNGNFTLVNDLTEFKHLQEKIMTIEKMETLGKMAGTVAHDLNNILSGIVTLPDLLLLDMDDDHTSKDIVETIKSSGKKAAAVVEDLLTFSRRAAVVEEVLNINSLIGEYLSSFEFGQLKERNSGVKVEYHLEAGLKNIKGSRLHLTKTIMNIISNAMEAIEGEGDVVVITRSVKEIEKSGEKSYIRIDVSDTGSGMNEDDQKKIFEPFYTTKVMGMSGTGLGLAIVKATISDHKGKINIRSKPGQGTVFSVKIPTTEDSIKLDDGKKVEIIEYMGNNEKILIVDDNPIQREMAKKTLKKMKYNVTLASSGEEAVQISENKRFDLVLLDMILGDGMDGLDTCEMLIKMNKELKVIIVSGYAETDRVRKALNISKGIFLKKPYTLRTIAQTVKRRIDSRSANMN